MGIAEEASDGFRELLELTERSVTDGLSFIFVPGNLTSDALVLDVLSHPRVEVELRRVGRPEEKLQTTVSGSYELWHFDGLRYWAAVPDHEDRPVDVMQQSLAEFDEAAGIHGALLD